MWKIQMKYLDISLFEVYIQMKYSDILLFEV